MSQRQKKPVVASTGATAARRKEKPVVASTGAAAARRKEKPVVAPARAAAAPRRQKPMAAYATDDGVVDNPGNRYGEARLVLVIKRNIIIAIKLLRQTKINFVKIIIAPLLVKLSKKLPFVTASYGYTSA